MPVKTFFNDGQSLVLKSLEGLCAASPELIFNKSTKSMPRHFPLPILISRDDISFRC